MFCIAHLIHSAIGEIRTSFPKYNNLIANIKTTISKYSDMRSMSSTVGFPICLFNFMGTWSKAVLYMLKITEDLNYC